MWLAHAGHGQSSILLVGPFRPSTLIDFSGALYLLLQAAASSFFTLTDIAPAGVGSKSTWMLSYAPLRRVEHLVQDS
jgi:hypothetical protein